MLLLYERLLKAEKKVRGCERPFGVEIVVRTGEFSERPRKFQRADFYFH
jgi:hypothetical protein